MTALHLQHIRSFWLSAPTFLRHLQALKGVHLHVSALCAM